MCDDCQAYAHHLGRADTVLDANGGTDVYQTTPARIELTEGVEHLRGLRLSPKGLIRWYAGCCNTPIANTLSQAKMPFAGIVHSFMDHASDGRSRDEALGPLRARTQARFGHEPLPPNSHARAPVGLIARSIKQLLGSWIAGEHSPSPFFDANSRKPNIEPLMLAQAERETLRERVKRPPHET